MKTAKKAIKEGNKARQGERARRLLLLRAVSMRTTFVVEHKLVNKQVKKVEDGRERKKETKKKSSSSGEDGAKLRSTLTTTWFHARTICR